MFEVNMDSMYPDIKKNETKLKKFTEQWGMKKNDSFFSPSVIKKRLKSYEKLIMNGFLYILANIKI